MLTKSKYEVAKLARDAAKNAICSHSASGWNSSSGSVMGQLTELIAIAVEAGVLTALENIYTNEEFERDINLKP